MCTQKCFLTRMPKFCALSRNWRPLNESEWKVKEEMIRTYKVENMVLVGCYMEDVHPFCNNNNNNGIHSSIFTEYIVALRLLKSKLLVYPI